MPVYLFRHGPAKTRDPRRWPHDELRPLTGAGRTETRAAARGLTTLLPTVDRLLTSRAERARATADILAAELPGTPEPELWDELRPGVAASVALARLGRSIRPGQHVLVVGHEPQLGEVIGLSLVHDAVSLVRLTRAGAAAIEFPRRVAPGGGRLEWLLGRRALARLAA